MSAGMLSKTERKKVAKIRRELIKAHKAYDKKGEFYDGSFDIDEAYEQMLVRLGWQGDDPVDTPLFSDHPVRQAVTLSGMYTPPDRLIRGLVRDPWGWPDNAYYVGEYLATRNL